MTVVVGADIKDCEGACRVQGVVASETSACKLRKQFTLGQLTIAFGLVEWPAGSCG